MEGDFHKVLSSPFYFSDRTFAAEDFNTYIYFTFVPFKNADAELVKSGLFYQKGEKVFYRKCVCLF